MQSYLDYNAQGHVDDDDVKYYRNNVYACVLCVAAINSYKVRMLSLSPGQHSPSYTLMPHSWQRVQWVAAPLTKRTVTLLGMCKNTGLINVT